MALWCSARLQCSRQSLGVTTSSPCRYFVRRGENYVSLTARSDLLWQVSRPSPSGWTPRQPTISTSLPRILWALPRAAIACGRNASSRRAITRAFRNMSPPAPEYRKESLTRCCAGFITPVTQSLSDDLRRRGFQCLMRWSRGVDNSQFKPSKAKTLDRPRPIFLYPGRLAHPNRRHAQSPAIPAARLSRRRRHHWHQHSNHFGRAGNLLCGSLEHSEFRGRLTRMSAAVSTQPYAHSFHKLPAGLTELPAISIV